ncbi:MAG: polysaccharide biosynthesis tyrosine autokinase [bacterium]
MKKDKKLSFNHILENNMGKDALADSERLEPQPRFDTQYRISAYKPEDKVEEHPDTGKKKYNSQPVSEDSGAYQEKPVNNRMESISIPGQSLDSNEGKFLFSKKDKDEEIDYIRYITIIVRRWRIIGAIVLITLFAGIVKNIKSPRLYVASTKIFIKAKPIMNIMAFSYYPSYMDQQNRSETYIEMLKSNQLLERVQDRLQLPFSTAAVRKMINVEYKQGSSLILLKVTSSMPERAAAIANILVVEFIKLDEEMNRKDFSEALNFIQENLKITGDKLKIQEEALKFFQETYDILEIASETSMELTKLSGLESDLKDTRIEIIDNHEKLNMIKLLMKKQDKFVEISTMYDNSLQQKLVELNIDLTRTLSEYGPKHRKVTALRENISQIEKALTAEDAMAGGIKSKTVGINPILQKLQQEYMEIDTKNKALQARANALEVVIGEMQKELSTVPQRQLELRRLLRDKESTESIYKLLKDKEAEKKIQMNQITSEIQQLDKALVPTRPIPTKKFFNLLIALCTGLVLGFGVAFLLEFFDQTIKSPQEVETQLDIPILGIIPLAESQSILKSDTESNKHMAEPYRSVRTNIRYTSAYRKSNTFILTSALQGEGKTTMATNLAITFAMEGKSVVIIDCDLRRSTVHKNLEIEREMGVSEYLCGDANIDMVLKPTAHSNLFAVTSGSKVPNPGELLSSAGMSRLLQDIKKKVDIVIIDSPATIPVSDAIALAPLVDSAIIVFRAFKTPMKAALQVKNSLTRVGSKVVGGIFNGIVRPQGILSYYYHYYGYSSYYYNYYNYYTHHYYYESDDDENTLKKPNEILRERMQEFKTKLKSYNWIILIPAIIGIIAGIIVITRFLGRPNNNTNTAIFIKELDNSSTYNKTNEQQEVQSRIYGNNISGNEKSSGLDKNSLKNNSEASLPFNQKIAKQPTTSIERKFDNNSESPEYISKEFFPNWVKEWAESWENTNMEKFLAFYSKKLFKYKRGDFVGNYYDWAKERKALALQTKEKTIMVSDISVLESGPVESKLKFVQTSIYGNRKSKHNKILEIKKINSQWKIVKEYVVK